MLSKSKVASWVQVSGNFLKYKEFSISDILHDFDWDTLEERRNQAILNMTCEIWNGNVILSPQHLPEATHASFNVLVGNKL